VMSQSLASSLSCGSPPRTKGSFGWSLQLAADLFKPGLRRTMR